MKGTIHACSYFCERPECVRAQRDELREDLKRSVNALNGVYTERNRVVAALAKCFPSCVVDDPASEFGPEWQCVYIQLPTGQVSWHFHESEQWLFRDIPRKGAGWDGWDGHDTEEKYRRLEALHGR